MIPFFNNQKFKKLFRLSLRSKDAVLCVLLRTRSGKMDGFLNLFFLGAVVAVNFYIVICQVTAPGSCFAASVAKGDVNDDFVFA